MNKVVYYYLIFLLIDSLVWFIVLPYVLHKHTPTLQDYAIGQFVGFATSWAAYHIAYHGKQQQKRRR